MTLLEEWVDKAEGDYKSAVILNRTRKGTPYDSVCYHCQQSAEKYLKAYLILQGAIPRRTHDLEVLLFECANYDATVSRLLPYVRLLERMSQSQWEVRRWYIRILRGYGAVLLLLHLPFCIISAQCGREHPQVLVA